MAAHFIPCELGPHASPLKMFNFAQTPHSIVSSLHNLGFVYISQRSVQNLG